MIKSRGTLNFLVATLSLVLVPFGLCSEVRAADSAQHFSHSQAVGFQRFRKELNPWKVLRDPEIKKRIRNLMGNKDTNFWNCTQLVEEPKISGDHYTFNAGVRGLYTLSESVFDLNLTTGNCCCGYLQDDVLHIFGAESMKDVPKPMQDYLNKRGFTNTEFDKADWTPIKTEVKPKSKKRLNFASLTGEYERKDVTQFSGASLDVLTLPKGKIKFSISAVDGGHSGQAEGTVPIINRRAVYRNGKARIEMKFNGPTVTVSGDDSNLCAIGVTLLGTFKKTDDYPRFEF